jgi:hypothetical protein
VILLAIAMVGTLLAIRTIRERLMRG